MFALGAVPADLTRFQTAEQRHTLFQARAREAQKSPKIKAAENAFYRSAEMARAAPLPQTALLLGYSRADIDAMQQTLRAAYCVDGSHSTTAPCEANRLERKLRNANNYAGTFPKGAERARAFGEYMANNATLDELAAVEELKRAATDYDRSYAALERSILFNSGPTQLLLHSAFAPSPWHLQAC